MTPWFSGCTSTGPELRAESIAMQKEEKQKGPEVDILELPDSDEDLATPWSLILYDDDVHTFDEVIHQLIKALGCSVAKAEKLTWKVHTEGKATVYEGPFEECLKRNSVLKEIELITEIIG
ncbi:MAG: ATP-dependent Clp protease adaptor ClpS [Balneolaceae bacterium]